MGNLYFSDFKVVSTINNIKIIYKILKEHSFVDSLELVDDNTIKGDNNGKRVSTLYNDMKNILFNDLDEFKIYAEVTARETPDMDITLYYIEKINNNIKSFDFSFCIVNNQAFYIQSVRERNMPKLLDELCINDDMTIYTSEELYIIKNILNEKYQENIFNELNYDTLSKDNRQILIDFDFIKDNNFKKSIKIENSNIEKNSDIKYEYYLNDFKKSEYILINDKKNGFYKEFYYVGLKKIECNYKDDKKDGSYKEWYDNGTLKIDSNYKDDKKDGSYKEWYDNGILKIDGNYKDDKKDGSYKEWYDGKLRIDGNYKDGKKCGEKWNDLMLRLLEEETDEEIKELINDALIFKYIFTADIWEWEDDDAETVQNLFTDLEYDYW